MNAIDYLVHPVTYDGGASDYQIVCPVCRYEYVHTVPPAVLLGNDNYDAVADQWVKGDVLQVPFWCEHGHRWLLQIGFHKGYTLLRSVITEPEDALQ